MWRIGRVASMTKSQTMATLAEKTGLSKKQTVEFMDELNNLAYKEAKNGFTIPGLGKLVIVNRKARLARNPATRAASKNPSKRALNVRIAKEANAATPAKPKGK